MLALGIAALALLALYGAASLFVWAINAAVASEAID